MPGFRPGLHYCNNNKSPAGDQLETWKAAAFGPP
jgi:hypothetical protein